MEYLYLPKALVDSADFNELSATQQAAFDKRIGFAKEVLHDARLWLNSKDGAFRDFADGLELDLSAAMNLDLGRPDEKESTWQIHSSWLFEVRTVNLAEVLSEEVGARMDAAMPILAAPEKDLMGWLEKETDVALFAVAQFKQAQDFDRAMAYLLALDVFLARMLATLYKWRLWQRGRVQ